MQGKKSNKRFFASQAFHYQTLRTLGHSAAFGANPGECLSSINSIRNADPESWYESWHESGRKCEKMAAVSGDIIGRGNALLRASNYFRASEFFLNPSDTRRPAVYRESANSFTRALQVLSIPHKIWKIPYERASMRAFYFPGDADKPIIIACGGYDSTLEELFFWIASAARDRGYPCVIFEGPGQSNMIREYDMKFTHMWEKPVATLLDYMQWDAAEIAGQKKILLGISMGAMLALRAAAIDKRIHAAAGLGGFFSMRDAALALIPAMGRFLYRLKFKDMFDRFASLKASHDIGRRWALNNGYWTIGADTPFDLLEKTAPYSLSQVADKITCDVLIMSSDKDHLIPYSEAGRFKQHIKNARSIHEHLFLDNDGAGEHCLAGATEQFHQVFFAWVVSLFHKVEP